jgi:transmembrane sensor
MNKQKTYSDKEWEEIASHLSDEKAGQQDLLDRFITEDNNSIIKKWKELGNMSDNKEINVDKAWNKVVTRLNENGLIPIQNTPVLKSLWSTVTRIAAVALIVLALGSAAVYLNNSGFFSKTINVATGIDQKNMEVSLPDGSRIFLNRNTELSYLSVFGKHKRDVKLSGEAFFEIAGDVSKPFTVDAGNAIVKVTGTSFNVITKNSESAVEVYVKTGKVQISDNSGKNTIELDPEFIGTMNSKTSGKVINDNPNYMSWNTGHLEYSGQKLEVVFRDLKRVYNMDIETDDPGILDNPWVWTSPADNLPQDTIIRLICASFNLSFTKEDNVYHLTKK